MATQGKATNALTDEMNVMSMYGFWELMIMEETETKEDEKGGC